jgi:hypothetical protein
LSPTVTRRHVVVPDGLPEWTGDQVRPDSLRLPIAPEREENPKVAKPLRCRLRLHAWEDRENPETRDRYQVCVRCDAYRDRGRAAPGAGAAGVTGMGFG